VTDFDAVIPPGGEGKVKASLDTSHYKGPITKSVTVRARETGIEPVVLQLKADVVTALDVTPTESPFIRTTQGDPRPTELTVSSSDGRPFTILAVQADSSVAVTARPAPNGEPALRYTLSILADRDLPQGRKIATVTVTTDREKAERIAIRPTILVVPAKPPPAAANP
jgi:hypothetical protein